MRHGALIAKSLYRVFKAHIISIISDMCLVIPSYPWSSIFFVRGLSTRVPVKKMPAIQLMKCGLVQKSWDCGFIHGVGKCIPTTNQKLIEACEISKVPMLDANAFGQRCLLDDFSQAFPQPQGDRLDLILFSPLVECRKPHQARQEKAALQGWSECPTEDLSAREFALALGNAWPTPLATRIIVQLNKAMGWMSGVDDPYR